MPVTNVLGDVEGVGVQGQSQLNSKFKNSRGSMKLHLNEPIKQKAKKL